MSAIGKCRSSSLLIVLSGIINFSINVGLISFQGKRNVLDLFTAIVDA